MRQQWARLRRWWALRRGRVQLRRRARREAFRARVQRLGRVVATYWLVVIGFAGLTAGAWMWWPPAGYLVGGLCAFALEWRVRE